MMIRLVPVRCHVVPSIFSVCNSMVHVRESHRANWLVAHFAMRGGGAARKERGSRARAPDRTVRQLSARDV